MTRPSGHPELIRQLADAIRASGPITFDAFMQAALHDPEFGYYSAGASRLGPDGDFVTASDMGPAFGAAIARQVDQMAEALNAAAWFTVTEFGAGRGWLARDLIAAAQQPLRYRAVDASAGMRAALAALDTAPELFDAAGDPPPPAPGVVLAVELFDALAVHRVRRREGRLLEVAVDWSDEQFVEVEVEAAADVADWAARYGAAAEEGDEAEVCLRLHDAFARIDHAVERGYAIVIDYGDQASRLYTPDRRRGTLLAYRGHRTNEAYLDHLGEQDLTAHVNFTALTDVAEQHGWRCIATTTQDRFLIANGIVEAFEQDSYHDPEAVQQRLHIKRLIDPMGMGRIFKVYVYAKGEVTDDLPGLRDPFRG